MGTFEHPMENEKDFTGKLRNINDDVQKCWLKFSPITCLNMAQFY